MDPKCTPCAHSTGQSALAAGNLDTYRATPSVAETGNIPRLRVDRRRLLFNFCTLGAQ